MKRVLFLLPVVLLAACGGGGSPMTPAKRLKAAARAQEAAQAAQAQRATEKKPEPEVSTTLSYRFNGTDHLNRTCSTGLKEFSSRTALCMGLQDPEGNLQCALDKRAARFQADCAPELAWNESITCHFALLSTDAAISPHGDYEPARALRSGNFCAGRTRGGIDQRGTKTEGAELAEGLFYDADLAFVHGVAPGPDGSHFTFSVYRKAADGTKVVQVAESTFLSGTKVQSGVLVDGKFKYVLRCENTWACRSL